jgi:hypothetical protein
VYKWTDDEGVIHYGDRKPNDRNTERVDIRVGKVKDSQAPALTPREKIEALDERKKNEREQQKKIAREEAREKQRQANCETARDNLSMIDSNARIRVVEDGERRFLSPEEIQEQRARFQEIADTSC